MPSAPASNASPDLAPDAAALGALDDYAVLRVAGADARDFLDRQACADLSRLSAERSTLGGVCNPKGRLLAFFRALLLDGAPCLRLPRAQAEHLAGHLARYVLRADARPALDDGLQVFGLAGADAEDWLRRRGVAPPAEVNDCAAHRNCVVARAFGAGPRFELYGALADCLALAGEEPATADAWRFAAVSDGLPEIYPETRGLFVPQMANLDLVDALSFDKGCYPGQEVVARTHNLGKLKRRMFGFAAGSDARAARPGDPVHASNYADGKQPSGEVVDVCAAPEGVVGLASLRMAGLRDAELRLGAPDGPACRLRPLAYAVPEA